MVTRDGTFGSTMVALVNCDLFRKTNPLYTSGKTSIGGFIYTW